MSENRKKVAILGCTGSIGRSTVAVLSAAPERYETVLTAARSSVKELAQTAVALGARCALTTDETRKDELASRLPGNIRCAAGMDELIGIVTSGEVDVVLCAIIGTAGIRPVLAAIEAGKTVALASKEVMVAAGELVNAALAKHPEAAIIPVDSEHSGVFQALAGRKPEEVDTIWLTASGGPFRTWPREQIDKASLADALAHPTWSMGRKITIDSASMMNKALELVEAKYLFNRFNAKLDVLIHPQSVVHAMVEFNDGSLLAQCGIADMRLPIAYALNYPERVELPESRLDLAALRKLEFFAPDREKFPAFEFARAAIEAGGTLPCAMNAANEVAVEKFCQEKISFGDIPRIIGSVMEKWNNEPQKDLEQLNAADALARQMADEVKL